MSWLNVYVQVAYVRDTGEVLMPQYPQQVFVQIAEVCGPSASPLCVFVWHTTADRGLLEASSGICLSTPVFP